MFAGSLVLGFTLIGFAFWLQWNDSFGWPDEKFETKLDHDYHVKRSRSRRRIHMIIAACGTAIILAAIAGPGPIWIGAWMCVSVALMTVVILAGFDAFRTHRYHREKLPKLRQNSLGNEDG